MADNRLRGSVPADLRERALDYAKAKGWTDSELLTAALTSLLTDTGAVAAQVALSEPGPGVGQGDGAQGDQVAFWRREAERWATELQVTKDRFARVSMERRQPKPAGRRWGFGK